MDVTAPAKHVPADCRRFSSVFARLGDKWSVLIVMTLSQGPLRFNAIKRAIDGISQQMLTRALRTLERDGMVQRQVFPTVPPQVEYSLTGLGQSLADPIRALGGWVQDHMPAIEAARTTFDARGSDASFLP